MEQVIADDGDKNCTTLELPSGMHRIISQTYFPANMTSVQFVGVGEYVSVVCNYSDYIMANYTWYFDHLKSVVIQNLHFEGCPRPLRLDTVAEVKIRSTSFRSVTRVGS